MRYAQTLCHAQGYLSRYHGDMCPVYLIRVQVITVMFSPALLAGVCPLRNCVCVCVCLISIYCR